MLKNNFYSFEDADGINSGVATPIDGAEPFEGVNAPLNDASAEKDADGRKAGDDVRAAAQVIADAMVAKKLKNMPSKEELAEFRAYKESRKTEAERLADIQKAAEEATRVAQQRETTANAMIAAASRGVKAEHISDAVILAMAKVNDDTSLEEAMERVISSNPNWKHGIELPKTGSNPAMGADPKLQEIKRHF